MRIATSRATAGLPFSSWEQEIQVEMVKGVRKGLCPALREILIHGIVQPNKTTSLVPFLSCASPRAGPSSAACATTTSHPWELFVAFYRTKDGQSLMVTPQRSLAQSFSLEIQGGTSKQSLLVAIGNIIAMHQPYKRGPEAHFKAFLSSALKYLTFIRKLILSSTFNTFYIDSAKKIVPWLRIVLRSPSLLDEFYEPWAFIVQPGKYYCNTTIEKLITIFHLFQRFRRYLENFGTTTVSKL